MMAQACNPSTQEAEAGESWVASQSGLHRIIFSQNKVGGGRGEEEGKKTRDPREEKPKGLGGEVRDT
jgi:hypothetical protein